MGDRAGASPDAQRLPVKSRKKKKKKQREEDTGQWSAAAKPRLLDPAYPSGEEGVDGWRWAGGVRRWQRARLDPSGPHVGQELVGDFGEHFLSQAGHAEDVVTPSVDVVSERDKLCRGE